MKNQTGNKVYLGLGTNCGDRMGYLKQALQKINSHPMISQVKHSSVYETVPFGIKDQSDYLNCAVEIVTGMSLTELYDFVKVTETAIGRKERVRWGPREIDIDILIYDNLEEERELVTVPHKGIRERDFVIVPLLELDDSIKLPGEKILLKEYLNRITENYILSRKKIDLLT